LDETKHTHTNPQKPNAREHAAPQKAIAPVQESLLIAPATGLPTNIPKDPTKLNIPNLVPISSMLGAKATVTGVDRETKAPEKNPYKTQKTKRPASDVLTTIQQNTKIVEHVVHESSTRSGSLIRSAIRPRIMRPKIDAAFRVIKVYSAAPGDK
jgi:hypothetical protein